MSVPSLWFAMRNRIFSRFKATSTIGTERPECSGVQLGEKRIETISLHWCKSDLIPFTMTSMAWYYISRIYAKDWVILREGIVQVMSCAFVHCVSCASKKKGRGASARLSICCCLWHQIKVCLTHAYIAFALLLPITRGQLQHRRLNGTR